MCYVFRPSIYWQPLDINYLYYWPLCIIESSLEKSLGTCQRWRGTVAEGRQGDAVVAVLQTECTCCNTELRALELLLLFSSVGLKPEKRQPLLCSNPHTVWPYLAWGCACGTRDSEMLPLPRTHEKAAWPTPARCSWGGELKVRQVPEVSNRDAYTQN